MKSGSVNSCKWELLSQLLAECRATTGADAPSRALASAGDAGNHRGSLVQQAYQD